MMLTLKGIKKSYQTGDFIQHALKGVDVTFRKNEFVAVLGPSGSGKTTLLNIVGGLDRYDEGDLIINDKSTKHFKQTEWDAYRNNCVGFIFQSYNLISHISVLNNVEMSMTLSGYKRSDRKMKALEALDKVGLKEHAHKKPNQLSGGQMQRVAIARALVNNPDIILADEPTGALDSQTSVQIMELIKTIAKDKLVIMVTHNPELAKTYASRIVEFKDGSIIADSNPVKEEKEKAGLVNIKKTSMSYASALHLSFNNIMTKKGRTILTAFASSIGIIGIALILALSNGFQIQIDAFEKDSLSQMPITITQQAMQMDTDTMEKYQENAQTKGLKKYSKTKEVVPLADIHEASMHTNRIDQTYIDYIKKLDSQYVGGVSYNKATGLNIVVQNEDGSYALAKTSGNMMNAWTPFPDNVEDSRSASVVSANYDVLAGSIDTSKPGLIVIVDAQNRISTSALASLGFSSEKHISFDDIMNKELKVIANDDYYQERSNFFTINTDLATMYQSERSQSLKVQAIVRGKEGKELITSSTGIAYTNALVEKVIEMNTNSKIVALQTNMDYNVLNGQPFDEQNANNTKEATLAYLGAKSLPVAIYIYPKNFDAKDQ
ncbi:MAG: ABC transporter ATP-binding protein, partial [Erysipelotrichia bacterium]|nr:ABC transporter ATP-binding protein [Erysipelotrichia bacterium]